MKRKDFLLALDELLELEPGTVNGTEMLDSFEGWNSLAIISFMALVDERFGIGLQPRQIAECGNVAELTELLGDRITP